MHPAPEKRDRRECEWKRGDGLADASDLVAATSALTNSAFSWKPLKGEYHTQPGS